MYGPNLSYFYNLLLVVVSILYIKKIGMDPDENVPVSLNEFSWMSISLRLNLLQIQLINVFIL